jgi:hypothetical protein
MPTPSPNSAVLAGVYAVLVSSLATSCGQESTDGSGAGGAAGAAAAPAAGSGGTPGVGGTPFMSLAGKDSGTCKKTDEPCERTSDCCAGNLCNRNGPVPSMNGCKIACTQGSECPSGCCYQFTGNNGGMCAEAAWCSCGGSGAACSSTLPPCCDTHVCQDQCRQKCTQNSDCPTLCCVPVPLLTGVSSCMERNYCPP